MVVPLLPIAIPCPASITRLKVSVGSAWTPLIIWTIPHALSAVEENVIDVGAVKSEPLVAALDVGNAVDISVGLDQNIVCLLYDRIWTLWKYYCLIMEETKSISLIGNWDWIKSLLSLVPKADIKIVQLDLLGVAMVLFSFISYLQIRFSLSLHFHRPIGQYAYTGFSAWLEHFVWGRPIRTQVCLRTERPVKQTNKRIIWYKRCTPLQQKVP